jgi:hypothetical protein
MGKPIERHRLLRDWIHADEESSDDRLVFHTREHEFPPRRMPRDCLNFQPKGVLETGSPGPADRNVMAPGSWSLEADVLTLSGPGRMAGRFQVVAVDEETLVLRRCD